MGACQVGFLKEWQLYAQAVEGETWRDGKLEEGKLEKMSGSWALSVRLVFGTNGGDGG